MHVFNIATIFFVVALVGIEFSFSAFVNPAAWRLEPEAGLKLISRLALVLGRVMPVWYSACAVLIGIQTFLHWRSPGRVPLLAAETIWLLAVLASVFLLVPLNSRIAAGAADWQPIHRIWDRRHRIRIAALAIAALLLIDVLAG